MAAVLKSAHIQSRQHGEGFVARAVREAQPQNTDNWHIDLLLSKSHILRIYSVSWGPQLYTPVWVYGGGEQHHRSMDEH